MSRRDPLEWEVLQSENGVIDANSSVDLVISRSVLLPMALLAWLIIP